MYFSYFRGRQYELLALKELAQKKLIGNLVIALISRSQHPYDIAYNRQQTS